MSRHHDRHDLPSPPSPLDDLPTSIREIAPWADRCGVADLLDVGIEVLGPFLDTDPALARRLEMAPRSATLRKVILEGHPELAFLRQIELGRIAGATIRYLRYRAQLRRDDEARRKLWETDLPAPALATLSAYLRRQHATLLRDPEASEPVLYSESARFVDVPRLVAGERFIEVDPWGYEVETEVTFSLSGSGDETLDFACDCYMEGLPCPHLRVAIGRFLDALHGDPELAARLAETVGVPGWRRRLLQIGGSIPVGGSAPVGQNQVLAPEERLSWRVGLDPRDRLQARPYIQTRSRSGKWTPGRKVGANDLHLDHSCVAEHDRHPLSLVLLEASYRRSPVNSADLFDALVGHPLVFSLEDPKRSLEIRRAPLRMLLADGAPTDGGPANGSVNGDPPDDASRGLRLGIGIDGAHPPGSRLFLFPDRRHFFALDPSGNGTSWVIPVPPALRGVAGELNRGSEEVIPHEEAGVAVDVLARLAEHVEVDVDDAIAGVVETLPARLAVRLEPNGDGLDLEIVLPMPSGRGPDLTPGEGSREVVRFRDGELFRLRRDLAAERRGAESLVARLQEAGATPGEGRYLEARGTETSLDVLLTLREVEEETDLFWEEGADPWQSGRATPEDLRIRISRRGSLFEIGGEIEVDGQTLPVASLLAAVRDGRRFVRLGPARFARIEESLRTHLETLDRVATKTRRGEMTTGAVAASRLEDLLGQEIDVEGDASYLQLQERVASASSFEPRLPTGLQPTLRPYQQEGFAWLSRLAQWQAGAILADDMGLGKTVQTLALLLERSSGPALVVAPTSVCAEWRDQAARFAPDLDVVLYRGRDREEALERLGPGSVLVASYGVLRRDAEQLATHRFSTLVLDEAQMIKNASTRGSRAARSLDAELVVALTGTPLENHLGELWAIFRVVSPGLLGSWNHFRERFALPVERDGDQQALADLATLIRPFLLRRTKAQVAPELPPRTEIVRHVTLSRPERNAYEAVRVKILEQLATDPVEGEDRFAILAAITRLRQLACHPRLVDRSSNVRSSKLKAVLELLEEQIAEGQRSLVFSQFTRHLALLREQLDRRAIPYLYLDGSTPAEKRDRLVARWREDETTSLFLVSLRAGGTGLNLIGADTVLHLDPWWNPAVEDQATDRTHRIGQTRPVTVVRLITEATIEEAVLELHEGKRALARGILEGADSVAALDADALIELIRTAGHESPDSESDDLAVDEEVGDGEEVAPDEETSARRPSRPGTPAAATASGSDAQPRPGHGEEGPSISEDEREGEWLDLEDLDQLVTELKASLEREVARGTLARASAQIYLRTARRVLDFAQVSQTDTASLGALFGAYSAAVADDRWPGPSSDVKIAPTVCRRLERLANRDNESP